MSCHTKVMLGGQWVPIMFPTGALPKPKVIKPKVIKPKVIKPKVKTDLKTSGKLSQIAAGYLLAASNAKIRESSG